MSQITSAEVTNLFKNVYGDLQDILPKDVMLAKKIPFVNGQKVGAKFVEAIVLSHETGVTFGGSSMDAFEIEPANAGAVKQAEIEPSSIVLPSIIPFGVISRTAGGGEKAFYAATKHVIKNNLRSHSKFLENTRLYGQSAGKLGHISYATATYRGQSFTNGSGTLSVNGSDVTFTNGVSISDKMALIQPGEFAAGLWVAMEGVVVNFLDNDNNVVAQSRLAGVDAEQGVLIFKDAPPVPTALPGNAGSIKLAYKKWEDNKEAQGINNIISSRGTLFGIQQNRYALWNGVLSALSNEKLTFSKLQTVVASLVNRGGLEGDLDVCVNPRTWATINTTEAGSREYDKSYKSSEAENGFEAITFYHQTGKMTINAHRSVKEGEAYLLHLDDWSRSGSAEVSFSVPGINDGGKMIFPLENQAGYKFQSYSDQYLFCHAPARSALISGINDEASS